MTVLISNTTPYVIWSFAGGLVGACHTVEEAFDIVRDLRGSFPDKEYLVRDVDGSICTDPRDQMVERIMQIHDRTIADLEEWISEGAEYGEHPEHDCGEDTCVCT